MLNKPDFVEVGATEFKATCLKLLDQVRDRKIPGVIVTKRGKPVAEIRPVEDEEGKPFKLYGCMEGSATIPPGVDLTEPLWTEWEAEKD